MYGVHVRKSIVLGREQQFLQRVHLPPLPQLKSILKF